MKIPRGGFLLLLLLLRLSTCGEEYGKYKSLEGHGTGNAQNIQVIDSWGTSI